MARSRRSKSPGAQVKDDPRLANSTSDYVFAVTMFVVTAVIPWYFELPLAFDVNSPDFNPLIFVPVVFAGIGALMLARTGLSGIRARKFGSATLFPASAQLGHPYRPTVRTQTDLETTGDFVFLLKCIRKVRSSDDFEGKSSDRTVWKSTESSPAGSRSSIGVSVIFHIPSGLPHSQSVGKSADSSNVRWVLTVTAPVRGVNFRQDFTVTVR